MIIRAPRPQSGYLVVANEMARNTDLSYRARGLLIAILSRPDDWQTTSEQLASEGKEGRDAIRAALTELEDVGYIERTSMRDDRGRWSHRMVVFDSPREARQESPGPENPASENQRGFSTDVGFPVTGSPTPDNQALKEVPKRSTKEGAPRKQSVPLPDEWEPQEKEKARALAMDLDIDIEVERFRNHAEQNDRRCVSWDAAFRNWLIKAPDNSRPRPIPVATSSEGRGWMH